VHQQAGYQGSSILVTASTSLQKHDIIPYSGKKVRILVKIIEELRLSGSITVDAEGNYTNEWEITQKGAER
jgi:predicted transcriptional regulator